MHGWVRVTSQPEPGTAIFDAGKRDLPFDEGLPTRAAAGRRGGPRWSGIEVTALNDQHGFLSFDAGPAGTGRRSATCCGSACRTPAPRSTSGG